MMTNYFGTKVGNYWKTARSRHSIASGDDLGENLSFQTNSSKDKIDSFSSTRGVEDIGSLPTEDTRKYLLQARGKMANQITTQETKICF